MWSGKRVSRIGTIALHWVRRRLSLAIVQFWDTAPLGHTLLQPRAPHQHAKRLAAEAVRKAMDRDVGAFIGLIAVGSGAFVLVLSYLGAYMLGRAHGRRQAERSDSHMELIDTSQRLAVMESSVQTLSNSMERLRDAQRLLVAQQDHLSRKVGLSSDRMGLPAVQGHNTPS